MARPKKETQEKPKRRYPRIHDKRNARNLNKAILLDVNAGVLEKFDNIMYSRGTSRAAVLRELMVDYIYQYEMRELMQARLSSSCSCKLGAVHEPTETYPHGSVRTYAIES